MRKDALRNLFRMSALAAVLLLAMTVTAVAALTNEECLDCHRDRSLTDATGKPVSVSPSLFGRSVHAELSCTDCHSQPANFEDTPHFKVYRKVDCAACHGKAGESFAESFHGKALASGNSKAPDCITCHGINANPHQIEALNLRTAETACRRCHITETSRYDGSVHAKAASSGKNAPGCVSCHPTHSAAMPPSVGAINHLCEKCHVGAMQQVEKGAHLNVAAVMSCASCHEVHATHKPRLDKGILAACQQCHAGYREQFIGSVHESLMEQGTMNCLSCHRTHQVTDVSEAETFGCGACHTTAEGEYRNSVHRLARLHGNRTAATCADCHTGHHVKSPNDPESQVYRENIPKTCGRCHGDQSVVTADYVKLPISLPSYTISVHGKEIRKGLAAVCTDCHGVHNLQGAGEPTSSINRQNLAVTCGKCHPQAAEDYLGSIHGRAVALGIKDSPSCTDCHDEHLILDVTDPKATTNPANLALMTCGRCHEDPAMSARYGIPTEVVKSYEDSYHGWAIKRGGKSVAVCTDCHTIHDIRSPMDPASSVYKGNVVKTCGKCHKDANLQFAASYSHLMARDQMMVHDWVRLIYIWLIALVLSGMFLHNLIIFIHALKRHKKKHLDAPAYRRMTRGEIIQHLLLAVSFIGLGLTGFALRFSDTWWVHLLSAAGMTEEKRRLTHRILAMVLVLSSFYHIWYVLLTRRGKKLFAAMVPRFSDFSAMLDNVSYYLGRKEHRPRFGMFDYTQKIEYWALLWGTAVMALTGFVLWFPTFATTWLPAWVVRVCETIHFYEAILAVSAIIIWHFFFEIFLPAEYPMNWTWLTGRLSKREWQENHPAAAEEMGEEPEEV